MAANTGRGHATFVVRLPCGGALATMDRSPAPTRAAPLPARVRPPQQVAPSQEQRMFVFLSHLSAPPADHAVLEHHFRNRSGLVDAYPGFEYLQLLRPLAGTASHAFLTAWQDRDSFRRYMRSMEHGISHSREPGDIMRRTEVRHDAYQVLMDSRCRPEWLGG
jgi:heme oxygenase (mycobilin-producing)